MISGKSVPGPERTKAPVVKVNIGIHGVTEGVLVEVEVFVGLLVGVGVRVCVLVGVYEGMSVKVLVAPGVYEGIGVAVGNRYIGGTGKGRDSGGRANATPT